MTVMQDLVLPTACLDWAERLKRGQLPISERLLPLKGASAERWSKVYNRLRLADVEGQPTLGSLPNTAWIDTIGRALWGGSQIREAMILVSKKNSKSSHGALMTLAAMLALQIPHHRFTVLAPTVSIAQFTFDQIVGAIQADPVVQSRCHLRVHDKQVEHLVTRAKIVVKAAALSTVTGLKGSVLVDELHVWGNMANGKKLRQQLKGALAASPHARGIYITTQSDEPPAGLFESMLKYARAVRDGRIADPSFLPVLFEPWPECDPWTDPATWPALLPSYPHVAGEDFYKGVISEANADGRESVSKAKSQYFNIEISRGEGATGWDVAQGLAENAMELDLETLLDICDRVAVGIDLGGGQDLTALSAVGTVGTTYYVWTRVWLTKKGLNSDVNKRSRSRFDSFIDDGDMKIVPPGADLQQAVSLCEQVRESGKLAGIGIDPASAGDLADALETAGFEQDEPGGYFGVGQTAFRLAPAVRTLDRAAEQNRLVAAEQEVLFWCARNVQISYKGNAPSITKDMAHDKIDCVMSTLDAVTVLITQKEAAVDVGAMIG